MRAFRAHLVSGVTSNLIDCFWRHMLRLAPTRCLQRAMKGREGVRSYSFGQEFQTIIVEGRGPFTMTLSND